MLLTDLVAPNAIIPALRVNSKKQILQELTAKGLMRAQISDPGLRARVTPLPTEVSPGHSVSCIRRGSEAIRLLPRAAGSRGR